MDEVVEILDSYAIQQQYKAEQGFKLQCLLFCNSFNVTHTHISKAVLGVLVNFNKPFPFRHGGLRLSTHPHEMSQLLSKAPEPFNLHNTQSLGTQYLLYLL